MYIDTDDNMIHPFMNKRVIPGRIRSIQHVYNGFREYLKAPVVANSPLLNFSISRFIVEEKTTTPVIMRTNPMNCKKTNVGRSDGKRYPTMKNGAAHK
jgi:hypothetical protein